MGIIPHAPVYDFNKKRIRSNGIFTIDDFTYDKSANQYICPQGKILKYHNTTHRQIIWRASTKDCPACPHKSQCTRDRARSLSIHVHHEIIEKAKREMESKGYKLSQRCRKKIEELFGEGKEHMGLRRMKRRGLACAAEQVFMTAAAQNIKRLVKHLQRNAPQKTPAIAKYANLTQKIISGRIIDQIRHISATLLSTPQSLPSPSPALNHILTR